MVILSDNSTNTSSNLGCNSLADKHWGVEARVFHVVDASEIELRPVEIARKIHAPRKPTRAQCTTVRCVLRKLLEKGLCCSRTQEVTVIKSPTGCGLFHFAYTTLAFGVLCVRM